MNDKGLVAHELGHAVAAEIQDLYIIATDLDLVGDEAGIAYCNTNAKKTKKSNIHSPYKKYRNVMDLGGIYGELLQYGKWQPWGARADLDDFMSVNKLSKSELICELDSWMWIDEDDLSFRACTRLDSDVARRRFWLDHHETFTRLPELWGAYVDFCNRIDKEIFLDEVYTISRLKSKVVNEKKLKAIVKGIINGSK